MTLHPRVAEDCRTKNRLDPADLRRLCDGTKDKGVQILEGCYVDRIRLRKLLRALHKTEAVWGLLDGVPRTRLRVEWPGGWANLPTFESDNAIHLRDLAWARKLRRMGA